MTTRYPATLPAVPADRWDFETFTYGGDPDDPENPAWATAFVTAASDTEAEVRVLAVIDHGYDDDLRGAYAEVRSQAGDTWTVRTTFRPAH